jgi:hypothetical protein
MFESRQWISANPLIHAFWQQRELVGETKLELDNHELG